MCPSEAEEVRSEISSMINHASLVFFGATTGLWRYWEGIRRDAPPEENPDPRYFFGTGHPGERGSRPVAFMRRSDALYLYAPSGPAHALLGQQWIVYVFARWEEEYRQRLSDAMGLASVKELVVPAFGDLRKFRNDIVHHGGVATRHNSGTAGVLRWYQPGELIAVSDAQILDFWDALPWELPDGMVWGLTGAT